MPIRRFGTIHYNLFFFFSHSHFHRHRFTFDFILYTTIIRSLPPLVYKYLLCINKNVIWWCIFYIIRLIIDKRRKGTIEQKNGTQEYICFWRKRRAIKSAFVYKMLGGKKSLETNSTRAYEIHNVHKKVQAWQHKKQHKTRQDIVT